MAVIPIRSKSDLTVGLEKISENKAIKHQRKLIDAWEPKSDVTSLRHGNKIIGGMCAASSIIINGLFRRKLKLYDRGLVLTSVYSLAGPSILGSFLYEKSITEDLMLYKHGCPLCYELKAAALINTTAILFPIITMPILNLGCAASLGLRVPYLTEVGELAKFWINVVKPASKHLATMFVMNSFIASMLARKQANSMDIIAKVVLLVQKDIREQETFSMIEQTEC